VVVDSGGNPYNEVSEGNNTYIREFSVDTDSSELVWHRDKEDREVTILEGSGWKFQYDNELPFELKEGDTISIKKLEYHRIIKGDTNLKIRLLKIL
jgi:quercetin dioxygenase-like cupin family protein